MHFALPLFVHRRRKKRSRANFKSACVYASLRACVCVCARHLSESTHTHTHTHTYIYIYIYIYKRVLACARARVRASWTSDGNCVSLYLGDCCSLYGTKKKLIIYLCGKSLNACCTDEAVKLETCVSLVRQCKSPRTSQGAETIWRSTVLVQKALQAPFPSRSCYGAGCILRCPAKCTWKKKKKTPSCLFLIIEYSSLMCDVRGC